MSQEIQFILYNLPNEDGKVQVIIRNETLWCTQKAMAQLFGVDRTVISKHLKNIFESSELQRDSVCAKFAHTAQNIQHAILQSGCCYLSRLSCKFLTSYSLSPMGY